MKRSRWTHNRRTIRRIVTTIGALITVITVLVILATGSSKKFTPIASRKHGIAHPTELWAIPTPINTGNIRKAAIFVLTITERLLEAALTVTRALKGTFESAR